MLNTEHLSTTSANVLHHDQKILTNNNDHHLLIEPSNDSMLPVDNKQQKLVQTPSSVNQYSLAQTTGDTCHHMMKNAIKSSTTHCEQGIEGNIVTFSGKKSEDAGKWLDHIFEVIEKQELTPTEQRDVAANRLTDDALLWYRLNRLKMPDMQCFIQQFLLTYNRSQAKASTTDATTTDVHYTLMEEAVADKDSEEIFDNTSKSNIPENHLEPQYRSTSPLQVLQSARNEKVKLFPNFSGSENSLNWLKNLQQIGKSLKFNEQQIYELATIKLSGPAQEWFYHQDEIDNWSSFKQAFLYTFPPPIQPTNIDYLAQLLARKQGETEPVGKFVQDINRLCLKLDNKISEQDKLQYLRRGLRPQLQHYALSITSLQDFLTVIQRHEQIEKETSNQQTSSRSSQQQQNSFNRPMHKHYDYRQNSSSTSYGSFDHYSPQNTYHEPTTQHHAKSNKICYQCNKPGHIQWNCPDNTSSQQQQHFQQRSH
ncbi:unnamed protein product [Rotaria sordida]|uniref:CCHC-type domain-containing protein n=1 Tax=Rotaria sordida TaxID=392033 RepID=A0A819VGM9_9BILA|nr:unnamed protein product [Rotaria sordida]CAF4108602.1 unnamed protein product [Rotaria sordida]